MAETMTQEQIQELIRQELAQMLGQPQDFDAVSIDLNKPDNMTDEDYKKALEKVYVMALDYRNAYSLEGELIGKPVAGNLDTNKMLKLYGLEEIQTLFAQKQDAFNTNATEKTNAFNQNATEKTNAYNDNDNKKTGAYNTNHATKLKEYNDNATSKTSAFDSNASAKQEALDTHVETVNKKTLDDYTTSKETVLDTYTTSLKEDINTYATTKVSEYDENHESKVLAYNNNATSKTTAFNTNASDKTTAFNSHVESKKTEFNSHVNTKAGEFDKHVTTKQGEFDANAKKATDAYNSNHTAKMTAYNDNATAELEALATARANAISDVQAEGSKQVGLATAQAEIATTKAGEASSSASSASSSASTASTKASEASTSASNAKTSETNASSSASSASTSAQTATSKASEASTSASNAKKSETNASESALNASDSASTATTKASEASASASSASTSAQTATSKASEAESSASNASVSATNASNAEAMAKKWASNPVDTVVAETKYSAYHYSMKASASAASASSSANTASTKAGEASSSASDAKTSETNAKTSETNAKASETECARLVGSVDTVRIDKIEGDLTSEIANRKSADSNLQTQINENLTNTDNTVNQMKSTMNKEAYIEWGGRNFEGRYGVIDGCLIPALGANRLAFANPAGVTVEYSRDSGASWTDYGASNASKTMLFTDQGSNFTIGNADSSNKVTSAYMLRVTLDTYSAGIYTELHKFCMYVSTSGSSGCYCTIEKALQSSPSNYETIANKVSIAGWSGYNVINVPSFVTYGSTPQDQYGRIRFTFGCTGHDSNYDGFEIYSIQGFGGVGWVTPSTMAQTGRIYKYNGSQDAIFPSEVRANKVWGAVAN